MACWRSSLEIDDDLPKTCEGGDRQIVHLLHDCAQSLSLPLRHDYIFILFLSQGRLAIHVEDKVKNKSRDSRKYPIGTVS